jgi:hypothetical protein
LKTSKTRTCAPDTSRLARHRQLRSQACRGHLSGYFHPPDRLRLFVLAGGRRKARSGDNRVPLSAHRWVIESADDITESAGAAAVRGVARAALSSRRRQRKHTLYSPGYPDHALDGPTIRIRESILDMGVFWSTKRQLFLFLACCFSITRSRRQVGTQPPNAHVYYSACPRAVCNVVPDAESVPRMVCIGCRMIGSDARPKWREHYDLGAITRGH